MALIVRSTTPMLTLVGAMPMMQILDVVPVVVVQPAHLESAGLLLVAGVVTASAVVGGPTVSVRNSAGNLIGAVVVSYNQKAIVSWVPSLMIPQSVQKALRSDLQTQLVREDCTLG